MTGDTLVVLRTYALAGDMVKDEISVTTIIIVADARGSAVTVAQRGIAGFGRHGLEVDLTMMELRPDASLSWRLFSSTDDEPPTLLENLQKRSF